ncbi:membrane protein [Niveispirillum irakense]|uniref:membrane protein n=1 Tax=Niveispirillum irakense TaxID=34011 RepID=UPI0004104450|nr:membrane protein [Niveispirillum irakense]
MNGAGIALSPLIPLVWLLPLAGIALALAAYGLWRRARGGWLRFAALAVLVLALLNPSWVEEKREPIKDVAVIVLDQSPSQQIGERKARGEKALADLQARLEREQDLDVRVVRSQSAEGPEGAAVDETRLMEAMTQAVADVPRRRIAGAILITDGQVHDVTTALPGLAGFGPVHTLLTGEQDEGDRRLSIVQAPSFGIVGKEISVSIRVDDLPGTGPAGPAMVRLRQDGREATAFAVPVGEEVPLSFPIGHGGLNVFELSVESGPQELTLANNKAAIVVNGVRDRLRVLLVSGEPHAGERTWRNLLKADPSVDLVHFTILRPPEKNDGTPIRELSLIAFPIRELFEMKLSEFDLIIFDRYKKRGVINNMYLANIADYVEKGGAFLEASGPTFATPLSLYRSPLGLVLPGEPTGEVTEKPFTPSVTELGKRHPVTAGLTDAADGVGQWGRWFRQVDVVADRGSTVMAGADGKPLLILDRVGEGRVAQLASDHIWLWSRGYEGGGPQAELLRRLAHWLMKEPELEENDLRTAVDGNRITITRRSLEPDTSPVRVTSPSDVERELAMQDGGDGQASASLTATEPGIWRVTDGTRTALAVVGTINPPELADVRTTDEKLAPAAKQTGGGIFWLAASGGTGDIPSIRRTQPDRDQHGRDWLGLRANGDHIVTGVNQVPLVPALVVLMLALGLIFAAWYREGRG